MKPALRTKLLSLYQDLRVADVRDAMDMLSLHQQGSMHAGIIPLWRTRAYGIAATARYLPYRGPRPPEGTKAYAQWTGQYYAEVCRYPWVDALLPGDFMVIDCSGVDAGLMGSENTLSCLRRGCRGFVSNAGVRDTDELIQQRVPFWTARVCQSMVQARLAYGDSGQPVAVGGVQVIPGDVVVADGDGVMVVPQEQALAVARLVRPFARRERSGLSRGNSHPGVAWTSHGAAPRPAAEPVPARPGQTARTATRKWIAACSIKVRTVTAGSRARLPGRLTPSSIVNFRASARETARECNSL